MSLYEGVVKKLIMIFFCFFVVVIFGFFFLLKLFIDLYLDIDINMIMVMIVYFGVSVLDIENNVICLLENMLNVVSNLKYIIFCLFENMFLIILEFEYGNDIDVLINDVCDKLDMVSLQFLDDVENFIIFKFSIDMILIVLLLVQVNESQLVFYKILDDCVVNLLVCIFGVGMVFISGVF